MSRTTMAAPSENRETTKLSDDRRKALTLAITQIEKTCGKGSIMRMGADTPQVRLEGISTGAVNLDAAIGIRGIPRGRETENFAPELRGQTPLQLHFRALAPHPGGAAAHFAAGPPLAAGYATKV